MRNVFCDASIFVPHNPVDDTSVLSLWYASFSIDIPPGCNMAHLFILVIRDSCVSQATNILQQRFVMVPPGLSLLRAWICTIEAGLWIFNQTMYVILKFHFRQR